MKLNNLALAVMLVTGVSAAATAAENEQSEVLSMRDSSADAHHSVDESLAHTQMSPEVQKASSVETRQTNSTLVSPAQATDSAAKTDEGAIVPPLVLSLPTVDEQAPAKVFTQEQEARIGEVAQEYLLEHPDILMQVSQKLEVQQRARQLNAMTQSILRHQDALLDDKSTPSYGPADAKVAFIEFFDYQCSVCVRQAPVIKSLMMENPQVRYVFKEWPIFAQRWEPSLSAAKTGLQVWQQKGADAYLAYHNALYTTGHDEGKLTQKDIVKAAVPAGRLKGSNDGMLEVLARTDTLAQNLGLRGTPGMIVMPVNGATVDNVTVIPGGASQSTLQAAIDKASTSSKPTVTEKQGQ